MKINSDEQHAIFKHEFQNGVKLAVGFSNNYFEPLQICRFPPTNLLYEHKIEIKLN